MLLTDNESDNVLWNRFRSGDMEAFVSIFKNYYSPLFNYGCRISRQEQLVEDCIQDLFLDLWRSDGKSEINSLKAYIFTAFKFKLLKITGKSGNLRDLREEDEANGFELSQEMLLIHEHENNERTQKVFNALQELPPRQKEIIYLKFYLGFGYEDVSRIMRINYQAARNLVYKSIKELKKIILLSILIFHSIYL